MTITCTGSDENGRTYHFGMPPTDWKLPKGYVIKMDRYPGKFAEVVSNLKTEPWNGEGLPPLGTVCEFMKHNAEPVPDCQWTVGEIRYVSDCYVIISGNGCEHAHHPRNCSFRPVRTPEQIAEDERDNAIQQLCRDAGSPEMTAGQVLVASRLYDAGYRKQK